MFYKYVDHTIAQSAFNNKITKTNDGFYFIKLASFVKVDDDYTESVYTKESVLSTFSDGSTFMKRVKEGTVFGEYGFPNPEGPSSFVGEENINVDKESIDEIVKKHDPRMSRIMQIDLHNTAVLIGCIHQQSITDIGNNLTSIEIYATVKPVGLNKVFIEDLLEDPQTTSYGFGMRGFTTDILENGRIVKTLTQCITFDFISNPKV